MGLICGAEGGWGGVHTNSFAMIMFLCVCGSSLHASSSL